MARTPLSLAFGAAGLALAALALSSQAGVRLRLTLKPNTVDHYKMAVVMNQTVSPPGMPAQEVEFTQTADYFWRYGEVKDGKADLELEIKNQKFESNQPIPAATPEVVKVKAKIDDRYQISDHDFSGMDAQARQMAESVGAGFQTMFFPDGEVKAGDTWEIPLPKVPFLGEQGLKVTAKFEGERALGGRAYYVISMHDQIPLDVDLAKAMEKAGQPAPPMGEMRLKGTMHLKAETLVEKDTGRVFSTESTMKLDTILAMPQMGGEMKTHGTVKSSMRLVRKA